MQTTANYGLKKPDGTDVVNIQDFNDNADVIDLALKQAMDATATVSPHAATHRPGGSDAMPTAAPSGGLGTANAVGSSTSLARADHTHLAFDSTNPVVNGTASAGSATTAARRDHVHPIDTTRAPLASPTLTGTPTAPTASADTSTTQVATTAFVLGQAGTVTPNMDGAGAVGTSKKYAREDHIHPTDTSRAPLASPALTGIPTAPTATADTNTTQVATTAYVLGQAGTTTPVMDGSATAGTSKRYARADHVHPTDTSRVATSQLAYTALPWSVVQRDDQGNVRSNYNATMWHNPNLLFNPSFQFGSAGWTGVGSNGFSVGFAFWGRAGNLFCGQSNASSPIQVGSYSFPVSVGLELTLSCMMSAYGVTSGNINISLNFQDGNLNWISNKSIGTPNGPSGWNKYVLTATAPANSVYAYVVCEVPAGTTNTDACWNQIKVETGTVATEYSDDSSLNTSQYGNLIPFRRTDDMTNMYRPNFLSFDIRSTANLPWGQTMVLSAPIPPDATLYELFFEANNLRPDLLKMYIKDGKLYNGNLNELPNNGSTIIATNQYLNLVPSNADNTCAVLLKIEISNGLIKFTLKNQHSNGTYTIPSGNLNARCNIICYT